MGFSRRALLQGLAGGVAGGLAPALTGCLPHSSLGRHTDLPAQRYALRAKLLAGASGSGAPGAGASGAGADRWEVDAEFDTMYSRTFRDGSIGTLVRFQRAAATINGAAGRSGLAGLLVELRAFERGEVLAVMGADAGMGPGLRMDLLDVLWPMLAPRLEGTGRAGGEASMRTSWPVGEDLQWGRQAVELAGAQERGEWSLAGTIRQEDRLVRRWGEVTAAWTLAEGRVQRSEWRVVRRVEPRWGGPGSPEQDQELLVTVTYAGDVAPLPVVPPAAYDSLRADSLRPVMQDGATPQTSSRPIVELQPFLLLPELERAV